MNSTLAVVATALLLATASAAFVEYSEWNLRNYFPAAVSLNHPQMTAQLNLQDTFDVSFVRRDNRVENVAEFEQSVNRGVFRSMPGNMFSLHIHGVGEFPCMAGHFDIKVDKHEGELDTISLFISFFESANNGFVFQVPVLKIPPQQMSCGEDWAKDEHVVLESVGCTPVSDAGIRRLQDGSETGIVVDMWFMKELLCYGISRSVTPDYIKDARRGLPFFITRPLLVDHVYMTSLQGLV